MVSISRLLPLSAVQGGTGCLKIAGHSLRDLAEKYGTPLYLYDEVTLQHQVSRLGLALEQYYPGKSQITYAAKAYFSLAFARHLKEHGLGVDVVSQGEMALARRAGFPAEQVHLHGNNKSVDELIAALEWNLHSIVIDSLDELVLLERLAAEMKTQARVWLRISPDVVVDTHSHLQTAHSASKFGLGIQDGQAGEAIDRAKASIWLNLVGLHVHLGSQIRRPEPYRQAVHRLYGIGRKASLYPSGAQPGWRLGSPLSA